MESPAPLSYSDPQAVTSDDVRVRLESTDLIPSLEPLLDQIEARFARLEQQGLRTAADLQKALGRKAALQRLAADSGVDERYLVLLRRALVGFFPKPRKLAEFDWVDPALLDALASQGSVRVDQLLAMSAHQFGEIAASVDPGEAEHLRAAADLTRVQWVHPTFARALLAAGITSADSLAGADADALSAALAEVNADATYYRGTVGRRDIARVIDAARYV